MSTPALALTAALFVLSVARVTRLINSDRVFDPVRVVVARRQRRWTLAGPLHEQPCTALASAHGFAVP